MAQRGITRSALLAQISCLPLPLLSSSVKAQALSSTMTSGINHGDLAVFGAVAGLAAFSAIATILLVKTRSRAESTERHLQQELSAARRDVDRCHALLAAEPQVLVAWRAGDDLPNIQGDIGLLLPQAGSPLRVLAFGTWLAPEPALAIEHAVMALRNEGTSFTMTLTTLAGRTVETSGRAIGGQAILRLREITGIRRELAETNIRQKMIAEESEALRALAAALPWPLWTRDANGRLGFVNAAYAKAVEARDASEAASRDLELVDASDRARMIPALKQNGRHHERLTVIAAGERRLSDVVIVQGEHGGAGIAVDISEAAAMRAELAQMAQAHRRMLDQLPTAVATFDARRQLTFYNDAYRRLWDLDRAFLDTRPDDSAVLDKLRAARRLPEEQDFRQWKAQLHESYRALEARNITWHLPDGRTLRVVTTPNPEGGVTYLYDDVSERLDLERRFDELIRVQTETLDNLGEAIAVFGSNGRLRLHNPPFAKLWHIDAEALGQRPHVETVERWCRALFDDEAAWNHLRGAITGIDNRASQTLRMERKDGSVLDCATIPLPDGATLVAFQDITDTVNVERALRERNEALEAAGQIKVDFVHNVSYELRSPLTTIIGFAHFLNDPSTGPLTEKQRDYLGYITASTNALLAIINNILDLATLDAGAMTLSLGPVDVRKAIDAAAEGIQDRLARSHLKLELDIDPRVGTFTADERRIVQILYNLLANAAGFSPENSTITLSARLNEGAVMLSVRDRGPGIAPDVQARMFDWFESHGSNTGHRGAGLGLSLVRSFVELHGGSVRVQSSPGDGTTVTCSFPLDHNAHRTAAE